MEIDENGSLSPVKVQNDKKQNLEDALYFIALNGGDKESWSRRVDSEILEEYDRLRNEVKLKLVQSNPDLSLDTLMDLVQRQLGLSACESGGTDVARREVNINTPMVLNEKIMDALGLVDSPSGDVPKGSLASGHDAKVRWGDVEELQSPVMPSPVKVHPVDPEVTGKQASVNPRKNTRVPWSALFANNRAPESCTPIPAFPSDGLGARLNLFDLTRPEDSYLKCLVGYFAGRYPGNAAISAIVNSWKANVTFIRHVDNWIVFKFQDEEDLDRILQKAPYIIRGRTLFIKRMPKNFQFGPEHRTILPVWVQLRNLPMEMWNPLALGKICSKLGKPLCADKLTMLKARVSFARVLVEVDVAKEPKYSVKVKTDAPSPSGVKDIVTVPDRVGPSANIVQDAPPRDASVVIDKGKSVVEDPESSEKMTLEEGSLGNAHLNDPAEMRSPPEGHIVDTTCVKDPVPHEACESPGDNLVQPQLDLGKEMDTFIPLEIPVQQECQTQSEGLGVCALQATGVPKRTPPLGKPRHISKDPNKGFTEKKFSNWQQLNNFDLYDAGRIVILWDPLKVLVQTHHASPQAVHCTVKCLVSSNTFLCSFIYGYNSLVARRPLWLDLVQTGSSSTMPWMLLSDFNSVLKPVERRNGSPVSVYETKDINDCFNEVGLSDLNSSGCLLTWSNGNVWSKLDRVVVNQCWLGIGWNSHAVFQFPGILSDHSVCLVNLFADQDLDALPFKFFNMWSTYSDFMRIVKDVWENEFVGKLQYCFYKKLQILKKPLRLLNSSNFSYISSRAKIATSEVKDLKKLLHNNPSCQSLHEDLKSKKLNALRLEEANRLFLAQFPKNRNLSESYDQVAQEFITYYKQLLGSTGCNSLVDSHILARGPVLNEEKRNSMMAPITDDEIKDALFRIGDNKAAGPDGFSAGFFKSS
ncbi:uncharacterized protein LOC131148271 [Malania oleifera]|uniref:uncharacterized protein LOC131148271 n=1 Tax=Malania oleifera TaxID=397392 RepID=UPI0025AEC745|nr:uncharacterized protein LOC131148271 [Malania oleifera]